MEHQTLTGMKLTFLLSKAVVASCFISTIAFTPFRIHSARVLSNKVISSGCIRVLCPPLDETPSIDRKGDDSINNPSFSKSSSSFSQKIIDLVAGGQVDAALHLLRNSSNEASESEVEEKAYVIVLQSLSEFEIENAPDIADELMNSMLARGLHPSNSVYNLVISIWSMSIRKEASKKCVQYLEDLWSQHEKSEEEKFVPMRSSYISTITSLARSLRKPGSENAEKAESLLEEMEEKMKKYPQLSPNTVAVNAVL